MQRLSVAGAIVAILMLLPFAGRPAGAVALSGGRAPSEQSLPPAAPHPLQQQLQAQLDAAKLTQDAAERAKAGRRRNLIRKHMQTLQETMRQMEVTKPQAGISLQEHDEWVTEQQYLMDQVLQQMMKDQELLMQARR